MIGSITHGFSGWTKIGSIFVLNRPGGSLSMPRALDIPYPVSYSQHGYQNFADGLRFPVLQFPAVPMNTATTPWFTAANLNAWFTTRSAVPELDLAAITGGIIFVDNGVHSGTGLGGWRVLSPKGAGFTLNCDKGQPVGTLLRFAGTDRDSTLGTPPAAPVAGTPLEFDAVTLGGDLANVGIIGVSLQLDTGLTPNMELDGSLRPVQQNAGLLTATLTIRMNATNLANAPGWNVDPTAYTAISGSISVLRVTGANGAVVFSFTKGVLVNPDERRQAQGRIIREFTYNLLGTSTADPVTIADV